MPHDCDEDGSEYWKESGSVEEGHNVRNGSIESLKADDLAHTFFA